MSEPETKRLKLFGERACRVTTKQMHQVFAEVGEKLAHSFRAFELVKPLASKYDHGDIDILALVYMGSDVREIVEGGLGDRLVDYSRNGATHSILYGCPDIRKTVHVDLIVCGGSQALETKRVYYAYGDTSAVIGVLSKRLHYKYGTEGFYKRYQDKRTIWHDLRITPDLRLGQKILGFPEPYEEIKSLDDIVAFMATNPMTDSSWFAEEVMTCADRQSVGRRPGMDYVCTQIREMGLVQKVEDEDFFLKQHPDLYRKVREQIEEIESRTYAKSSVYNGTWLMQTFDVKQGPQVGAILLELTRHYDVRLHEVPEPEVIAWLEGQGHRKCSAAPREPGDRTEDTSPVPAA